MRTRLVPTPPSLVEMIYAHIDASVAPEHDRFWHSRAGRAAMHCPACLEEAVPLLRVTDAGAIRQIWALIEDIPGVTYDGFARVFADLTVTYQAADQAAPECIWILHSEWDALARGLPA